MIKAPLFRKTASTAIAFAALAAGMGNAWAGWVQIGGPVPLGAGYPSNEGPDTVGAYLQDLLGLGSAPTNLQVGDHYGGAPLTGLGNPGSGGSLLLSFHFGNGNDYWTHDSNFDVFFSCTSNCDTFTLPDTNGISNYRLYGGADDGSVGTNAVPEPLTLSLVGIGLAGLATSRRRARK